MSSSLDIKRTDGHTPSIGVSVSDVRSSYSSSPLLPWLLEQSSANLATGGGRKCVVPVLNMFEGASII
jgi:hypothetical protein